MLYAPPPHYKWWGHNKQVIAEINQTLKSLDKEQIQITLKWTPGHADIAGNEIADQLAKTAAEGAERMPEVTNLVTALDIKTAVQESCNIKWQKRWEAGATGRQLFHARIQEFSSGGVQASLTKKALTFFL